MVNMLMLIIKKGMTGSNCKSRLHFLESYVKVAKDLKHLCFFLKKLISRQREASESASFNLIPITHNIKGLDVQICRRGSPGGEI